MFQGVFGSILEVVHSRGVKFSYSYSAYYEWDFVL